MSSTIFHYEERGESDLGKTTERSYPCKRRHVEKQATHREHPSRDCKAIGSTGHWYHLTKFQYGGQRAQETGVDTANLVGNSKLRRSTFECHFLRNTDSCLLIALFKFTDINICACDLDWKM